MLGLPTPTKELKSITPFLQRAEELKPQEPVVAYWCAYYAAQLGITLKAKDSPSRDFLFSLLATLERLKKEIGPNDAIDDEAASAAHVENFALRVFTMADNEDRSGNATRGTAKKFLAASNFLQVLGTFPATEMSQANEEKMRYAKWKAADIAKAFREGRKPTPGPPGSELDQELDEYPLLRSSPSGAAPSTSNYESQQATLPQGASYQDQARRPRRSSNSPTGTARTPPPAITQSEIARANQDFAQQATPRSSPRSAHLSADPRWQAGGDISPGSWSTTATPGAVPSTPGFNVESIPSETGRDFLDRETRVPRVDRVEGTATPRMNIPPKPRSGSGSSGSGSSPGRGGGILKGKKAWVSEELEGRPDDYVESRGLSASPQYRSNGNGNAIALGLAGEQKKTVHFTPSVVGGESSTAGSPPASPAYATVSESPAYDGPAFVNPPYPVFQNPPPSFHGPPRGSPPRPSAPVENFAPLTEQSNLYAPPGFVANLQQGWQPPTTSIPYVQTPSPPRATPIYRTPSQNRSVSPKNKQYFPLPPPPPPQAPPSPPPFELTPAIVTKAQKHCRFAMSALDYDDVAHARKELRAALALLGGE